MPILNIGLNNGLVTSRDAASLSEGELVQADGIRYRPGDTERAHTIPSRSTFADTASAAKIIGLALCQYDSGGTDRLLALSNGTLYSATPGTSGTFSSLIASLSTSATRLSRAHDNDRWYVADGYDSVRVIENNGTTYVAGMASPVVQPVCTPSAPAAAIIRPAAGATGFTDPDNARDTTDAQTTFAYSTLTAAGSSTCTWTLSGYGGPVTRTLYVKWRLTGVQTPDERWDDRSWGVGGTSDSGFRVTCLIEYSIDGAAYVTLANRVRLISAMPQAIEESASVTVTSTLAVRVTFTYVEGSNQATMQVYDIRTAGGSAASTFSTTTGFYYAVSEYDSARGHESAIGPASKLTTLASQNLVTVTLPSAARNTRATHWRIYRTADGGSVPQSLGLMNTVPISQTQFVDDFTRWGATDQPRPLVPMLEYSISSGTLRFPRDTPPPILSHLNAYKGSLLGLSRLNPRSLYYSEPGFPESWPEIYVVDKFPIPERDELVSTAVVGDSLLVAAKGAMLVLNDLPRVVDGQFNAAEAVPLRGQPGCVGVDAITSFSVAGESRAAWVSPYGVHETNGSISRLLTSDLDWPSLVAQASLSSCVLHWNPQEFTLKLAYPPNGGTTNTAYLIFHMAPEHAKANGMPKITKGSGSISCLAGGLVGATYRQYSGHISNGIVYLEDASGADSATLQTGRIYGGKNEWYAYKGNLRHSDMGAGTATLALTMNRDPGETVQTVSKTISLDGQRGTEFYIGRSGEWAQISLTYSGGTAGSFLDCRIESDAMAVSGRVA